MVLLSSSLPRATNRPTFVVLASLLAATRYVHACEGECIVGVTNAWIGNYTTPVTAVLESLGEYIANLMLPESAQPGSGLEITQPLLTAWQSTDTYYGMRTAIFPSFFHGKCLLPPNGSSISSTSPDPLQEGVEAPGCPDTADCSVVCGTPGSMVHFYDVLESIAFNATVQMLTNYTTPGNDPFEAIAQDMVQRIGAAEPEGDQTEPTSARFVKRSMRMGWSGQDKRDPRPRSGRELIRELAKDHRNGVRAMGIKVPFPMRMRMREYQDARDRKHGNDPSLKSSTSIKTKAESNSFGTGLKSTDAGSVHSSRSRAHSAPRAVNNAHGHPGSLSSRTRTSTKLHGGGGGGAPHSNASIDMRLHAPSYASYRSRRQSTTTITDDPSSSNSGNWTLSEEVADGLGSAFFYLSTYLTEACNGTLPTASSSSPDGAGPPSEDPASVEGLPGETGDQDPLSECSWESAMKSFILSFN